ncbi:transposase [Bradyrhizobium sp. SZCCHNR1039]|nr:transposase [Bradyrhizobium sp. SZCCHNR1039]
MSVRAYAKAHGLSRFALGRWSDLIETNEVVDWRAQLHPSARAQISTSASSAAKESGVESRLTDAPSDDPSVDGRSNRRRFSDEEKLAIVRESDAPNASAAEVCRRYGIVTSMLFRWRVQFGFGRRARAKLARVEVANTASDGPLPLVLHDLLQPPDGMVAVELADGRRVFAPADADLEAVRRHVAARKTAL